MPYLSRIRINPCRSTAQALLANPHRMKIEILNGLPQPGSGEGVLWRLEDTDHHRPHLLVLTPQRPDWSHIIERAGWPGAEGEHARVRDYTPLLDQLALGREFAFRLRASPVHNVKQPQQPSAHQHEAIKAANAREDGGKQRRGFRTGHRTARHQMEWLLKRTHKYGFQIPEARTEPTSAPGMPPQGKPVPDVRLTARQTLRFDKNRHNKGRPPITITTATFEGRLRVTDPHLLRTVLLAGIGPSKRYGCGLLTLAPLTRTDDDG